MSNFFKPMSEVHALNLRSSENGSLYVPEARTALYDGSFIVQGYGMLFLKQSKLPVLCQLLSSLLKHF